MKLRNFYNYKLSGEQFILIIALIEFLIFIISGTSFSFLHDFTFFNFGVDPFYWILFLLKIPKLINSSAVTGIILDVLIVVFFIVLIFKKGRSRIAIPLFFLMLIFYITLTAFLGHRNYQTGLVFIMIPFLFHGESNRKFAFEAIRYFLLFFYVSAGMIKIIDLPQLNHSHFSIFLQQQFLPYYLEGNTGWRTSLNSYLITHENLSFILYVGAIGIELFTLAGFFTRRFDKVIGAAILLFHLSSWILMDIAPIGQLAFVSVLFCIERKNTIESSEHLK